MKIVLNDEAVKNDYGFRILNSGIDLTRFNNNNVLLYRHNNYDMAIGNVTNIITEGSQLVGEVVFDDEDTNEDVKRLISKYKRGVMKGFSMGVLIKKFASMEIDFITDEVATESELYEVSCETLQSNKNTVTVKLMNNDKELFKLGYNKGDKTFLNQNKESDMDLKKLASILGLSDTATLADVETAAQAQAMQLVTLRSEIVDSLVTEAVTKGMVGDESKEGFKKLATADFASAKTMVSCFKAAVVPAENTPKTPVAEPKNDFLTMLKSAAANGGGGTPDANNPDNWDYETWSKRDSTGLAKLKAANPDKFNALLQKHREANAVHLS